MKGLTPCCGGCLVGMELPLILPCLADPDRAQVTRLEAEATIPPVASPSQPILVVSLQEEQDKCKGTCDVSAAQAGESGVFRDRVKLLIPSLAGLQCTALICYHWHKAEELPGEA